MELMVEVRIRSILFIPYANNSQWVLQVLEKKCGKIKLAVDTYIKQMATRKDFREGTEVWLRAILCKYLGVEHGVPFQSPVWQF
jgi:hypothetical protein